MILEQDLRRIIDAACSRLEAAFDAAQENILLSAVRSVCRAVGREIDPDDLLSKIAECEIGEHALRDERDVETGKANSFRSVETSHWANGHGYLIRTLGEMIRKSSQEPLLARCNMVTAFALVGHAIRIIRSKSAGA